MSGIASIDRRRFLALTGVAAGAFALGVSAADAASTGAALFPTLMVSIRADGAVLIVGPAAEMGQGVATSLPLILAEELDADWAKVEVVGFSTNIATPQVPPTAFITSDSQSTRLWFDPMRRCGAAARQMLVSVAARRWGVSPHQCETAAGKVLHPDGRKSLDYGALAAEASREPIPTELTFKSPDQYRLIGYDGVRSDVPDKTQGKAAYAIDIRLPGMLFASVRHGSFAGAELKSFDEAAIRANPRVKGVYRVNRGADLAVVATDSWSAMQALEAADPVFALKPGATADSAAYAASLIPALDKPGAKAKFETGAPAGPGEAGEAMAATYEVPFLAHATMEPMSCAVRFTDDGCEIWAGSQAPLRSRDLVAAAHKLAPEKVILHRTFLGGGFGRRSEADFILEAADIAKQAGVPICMIWSRTEDMSRDFYRPAFAIRHEARLAPDGKIVEWRGKIAGPSLLKRTMGRPMPGGAPDPTVSGGTAPEFYQPRFKSAEWVEVENTLPAGFWRSVSQSQNCFPLESFMDELAASIKTDPLAFRRLNTVDKRGLAVLDKLAEISDWGARLPTGRARGMATTKAFGSYFATVVEASLEDGEIRLHSIANVVDCGLTIHPQNVVAQIEGGMVFGLSAALHGEIVIKDGETEQMSFTDYPVLLIKDTPPMRTHVMASTEKPGGVGEIGTPAAAPALANALAALTGKRVRKLPLAKAYA